MAALIAVLLASLFGSLHCAGMCGPLVAFAVGAPEARSVASRTALQVAYHGGRLVTYALVGAICGVAGAALDLGGSLVGLQRVASVLAGVMAIAVSESVRRSLDAVRRSMTELANREGDLTKRMPVETVDEVGRTGSAFNEFMAGLQDMIRQIRENADAVAGA